VIDTSRGGRREAVRDGQPGDRLAGGEARWKEGCLSSREAEEVDAPRSSRSGSSTAREAAERTVDGLTAIAVQHECDHLEGVLFVDHLSALKRELIRKRMKRLKQQRDEDRADA